MAEQGGTVRAGAKAPPCAMVIFGATGDLTKRLLMPAIYNLGAIDVLCTDKTGTLTEARIVLTKHVDIAGNNSERVLTLAWLNSHFESGLKSPLDHAVLAHDTIDPSPWRKIDE